MNEKERIEVTPEIVESRESETAEMKDLLQKDIESLKEALEAKQQLGASEEELEEIRMTIAAQEEQLALADSYLEGVRESEHIESEDR